jgi:hypothetical protein
MYTLEKTRNGNQEWQNSETHATSITHLSNKCRITTRHIAIAMDGNTISDSFGTYPSGGRASMCCERKKSGCNQISICLFTQLYIL